MDTQHPRPTSPNHPTTRNRTRVHHLGLDTREVLVIESLFRAKPELATRYQFAPCPESEAPDILFVNADDSACRRTWDALHAAHPDTLAILVTASPETFPGQHCLPRPLNFRDFAAILDAITAVGRMRVAPEVDDAGSRLHVLVVDDSFPARQFMKFKLESIGTSGAFPLDVDFAESGEQAVTLAAGANYDLAFMDVEMPGIDGYEACRQLKALQPLRVAMLTSRTLPADFSHGHAAGCDNYLAKPPNDTELRSILRLTSLRKLRDLPASPSAQATAHGGASAGGNHTPERP